jgi:hypothetical protein
MALGATLTLSSMSLFSLLLIHHDVSISAPLPPPQHDRLTLLKLGAKINLSSLLVVSVSYLTTTTIKVTNAEPKIFLESILSLS